MSTWTSESRVAWWTGARRGAFAIAASVLAGCGPLGFGGSAEHATLGGGMIVAGPAGFCILDGSRKTYRGAEFVALAPCRDGTATDQAVLTATVGPAGSGEGIDPAEIVASGYFGSPPGRLALSRSGDPRTVTVHATTVEQGTALVHLTDRSPAPRTLAQNGEGWRALLRLRGRIVTLSVQAQGRVAIAPEEERRLIDAFVGAMRSSNGNAA